MSGDLVKKKILEEVLSDQYGSLGISRVASFSHGEKISPNLFLLAGEHGKKYLVRIKDKEYNNQEQLENLYSILKKRKFSAIYPLKSSSGKYIARKHNLLVQVLPFLTEQRFDVDEKKSEIIKLFSSFYNSLNSDAKFLASLDAEIFEKSKGKFERFVKEYGRLKKLREAFFDLGGLVERTREYLRAARNLKCCHWNCWEENLLYSGGKLFLIDFDTFGLGDHRSEIVRVLTDFRREGHFMELEETLAGIREFNKHLIPNLRISVSDKKNLDILFFYNVALKITKKNVSDILNPGVRSFYLDWKRFVRTIHA